MFGATTAFVGQELVVRVYLALEPLEERLAGWVGASTAVAGASPGDLGCYPLVDVLGQVASPRAGGWIRLWIICLSFVYARLYVQTRASERQRQLA
jgi:hypothetical protein